MMSEWSKLPIEGRPMYQDWLKRRIIDDMEQKYGVKT